MLIFYRVFVFICLFLMHGISFAHVGLWDKAKGETLEDKDFNGFFAADIKINDFRNIHVSDIGIDYLDTGADSIAQVGLRIYDGATSELLFKIDTCIKGVFKKQVFLECSFLFLKAKQYRLVISAGGPNSDNKIHVFAPHSFPFQDEYSLMSLNNAFASVSDSFPSDTVSFLPFLNFGIDNQTGIDFFNGQDGFSYMMSTQTLTRAAAVKIADMEKYIRVDSIGLNYFDVGADEVGKIGFRIYNSDNGSIIASKDTVILNIHRKEFKIPLSANLFPGKNYTIGVFFDGNYSSDDGILLHKPQKIPYVDNLNLLSVNSFLIAQGDNFPINNDTSGVFLSLNFEFENMPFVSVPDYENLKMDKLIISPQPAGSFVNIDVSGAIDHSNQMLMLDLYNLNGQLIDSKRYTKSKGIVFETNDLDSGIYLLKFTLGDKLYFDKLVVSQ